MGLDEKNMALHSGEVSQSSNRWEQTSGQYHNPGGNLAGATYTLNDIARTASPSDRSSSPIEKQSFSVPIGAIKPLDPAKSTILVVDDAQEKLEMYARIFESAGYNVVTARDGLEGLDRATKVQPELIFAGIIMPRMDGFAMIEGLKKNAKLAAIPVVMNSHLGRSQDKVRARELGVREFIIEGNISHEELVDRVHAILTLREHTIPLDLTRSEFSELVKDLGGIENIKCPVGKQHVLRISLIDPNEMTFDGHIDFI